MSYGITLSGLLLLGNAIISLILVRYVWKRRALQGAIYLCLMMLSIAIWSLSAALEDMAMDYTVKVFLSKISYLGVTSTVPFWFLFAFNYHYGERVKSWLIYLIWIVPVLIFIAAATNDFHRLVWPTITWGPLENGHRLIYSHGSLKYAFALYSYIFLLSGTFILIRSVITYYGLFRWQIALIIIAALAPWAGNITYLAGITPPWLDTTPLAFTVTGVLISFSLFRYQLLNIAPIAYDTLFMNMADGVLVSDIADRIVNINPVAMSFLCIQKDIIGNNINSIPLLTGQTSELFTRISEDSVELNLQKGSHIRWIDVRVSPVLNRFGKTRGKLYVFRDITERKRLEDELTRYATTDTLTGVFNRRMGLAMLEKQLKLMQRIGQPLSICFADVNNLKEVNDRLGHEAGDRLIIEAAAALREIMRELDSLARLGGDEFLMILPNCTRKQADMIIKRIDDHLQGINSKNERPYSLSLSYGIAEYQKTTRESADELIARADEAMYADKKKRKEARS